jgi:hypothetical protein
LPTHVGERYTYRRAHVNRSPDRANLITTPRFAIADDLAATGAKFKIIFLFETLAAEFVFRLNFHTAERAMIDDERI